MRGMEPTKDSLDIEVLRFWGSCFLSKDGTKPKLFIAEWREIEEVVDGFKPETMTEYLHREEEPELDIEQEELPFY